MDFSIYQVGKSLPTGIQQAVEMINRNQTVWKLQWPPEAIIDKPSYNPNEILSLLPTGVGPLSPTFVIGVAKGKVDIDPKFSILDHSTEKGLITDYKWRLSEDYAPPEVFWVFALANCCFRASINTNCQQEDCLGFKDYTFDKLLLSLLSLRICNNCETKAKAKFKYQVPELRKLLDSIKRPKEYKSALASRKAELEMLGRQVTRQTQKGCISTFNGYGIVIIMHFLEDLVPFLEGLISLGADEESMVLIVKPYPYAQRLAVHSYLYENHRKIRIEYLDALPPSDDLLRKLIGDCKAKSASGKLLVIEDGGYVVPFLHNNYTEENNFCIGAVEQTTKGLRRDEEIEESYKKLGKKLYFPILNVAKSKFKDEYESPLVGRAVVSSIQRLLSDESFFGEKALVIGFGAVGREVANALKTLGMIVKVSDKDIEPVVAAKVRGFEAAVTPLELVRDVKLIIGTTGKQSIGHDTLEKMKNGTILVSSSSDLIEIDIDHLKIMAPEQRYQEGLGTHFVRKQGFSEDTYLLMGDGFPINFYSGSGIPNRAIEPILAQLFIGAIHIAEEHGSLEKRIISKMDDLIKEYKLLQDFLDIHGR
ncbi:MAG: NAD(P)-dependent oxidoreductase [Thermodesulfobacteriota bacterium]